MVAVSVIVGNKTYFLTEKENARGVDNTVFASEDRNRFRARLFKTRYNFA
jgi:hypothetical protein